nr:hypothetical protein [uncultured Lachnoclostridium sp.]
MVDFIKRMIVDASKESIENGQEKYRKYFVYTKIYKRYKSKVDDELIKEGHEDLIVTE